MKAIAYYRVSSPGQGQSGLGLLAQKRAVQNFAMTRKIQLVKEVKEIESAKTAVNRPVLQNVLDYCRKHNAVLLIAKQDRLARSVLFIATLVESDIEFINVEKPYADKFDILDTAVKDERERYYISLRTKEALAEAREKGVILGSPAHKKKGTNRKKANRFAWKKKKLLMRLMSEGYTIRGIVDYLNDKGVKTYQGKRWHKSTVHNLIQRMKKLKRKP